MRLISLAAIIVLTLSSAAAALIVFLPAPDDNSPAVDITELMEQDTREVESNPSYTTEVNPEEEMGGRFEGPVYISGIDGGEAPTAVEGVILEKNDQAVVISREDETYTIKKEEITDIEEQVLFVANITEQIRQRVEEKRRGMIH